MKSNKVFFVVGPILTHLSYFTSKTVFQIFYMKLFQGGTAMQQTSETVPLDKIPRQRMLRYEKD